MPLGQHRIAGDDGAAVAERAQILRRIEAERAAGADRADGLPPHVARCAWQQSSTSASAMLRGDGDKRRHVGRLAVEMHGQNRRGARRDRALRPRRDRGSNAPDRRRRRPVRAPAMTIARAVVAGRHRRRDDFVARADAERAQRQRDRIGAVAMPTACGAPEASANSRSNASTSGPSTNQPRSVTRLMASQSPPPLRRDEDP